MWKCVLFKFLTTMVGMCVVDMNKLWMNEKPQRDGLDCSNDFGSKFEGNNGIAVRKFSEMLCETIRSRTIIQYFQRHIKMFGIMLLTVK